MSGAAIVFASPDENLCRELTGRLEPELTVAATTHLGQVSFLIADRQVDLLVLDVRDNAESARFAERLLEKLCPRRPEMGILLLASAALLPESLESRLAASQVAVIRSPSDVSAVEGAIRERARRERSKSDRMEHPPAATVSAPHFQPKPGYDVAVFEGISRRFETRSPELKKMLEDVMVAAGHDVTILLIGETGSGKTFLSSLIHEVSPRHREPFLTVACGALPKELIESELFGHVKGAFTSAHADKEGKFLAARRGTVLLDEIDVLGPDQQVKLLRVIESGEFEPVGSNQTLKSQARLVVASNLELQPLVEQGRFRPDLYYRLNMLKFEIPPLRRRKVDIIPMAKKFIAKFEQKHNIKIHRIEESVLEALLAYPWPGNVRELEHVIQRSVIYAKNGVLGLEQLPPHILAGQYGPTNDPSVRLGTMSPLEDKSLEKQVSLTEKEVIEQTLFKNNFSRTKTAKDLGISRVTLYNKMKKYDMLK